MMIPVPEPSSRIVNGSGVSTASRSTRRELGSGGLGHPLSLRLKFESTCSGNNVDGDRRKKLGGSNSMPGSLDSKYVVRVYAASLAGYSGDKF